MMLSDRSEEILEILWEEIVENKKKHYSVNALTDRDAVMELAESGYIRAEGDKIGLTDKGEKEASNCVRRHRLAERLFADVLDVKGKMVHETGCRFEHLLHKGLDDSVCTLLGHPKTCPHGRRIPEGNCCREAKKVSGRLIMPLTDLDLNKKARISHLQTRDNSAIQKIIAIGALPNTEINLIQRFPSHVFQIGKSQFAIDNELASCIYVRIA